jgi:hypothetical protein
LNNEDAKAQRFYPRIARIFANNFNRSLSAVALAEAEDTEKNPQIATDFLR